MINTTAFVHLTKAIEKILIIKVFLPVCKTKPDDMWQFSSNNGVYLSPAIVLIMFMVDQQWGVPTEQIYTLHKPSDRTSVHWQWSGNQPLSLRSTNEYEWKHYARSLFQKILKWLHLKSNLRREIEIASVVYCVEQKRMQSGKQLVWRHTCLDTLISKLPFNSCQWMYVQIWCYLTWHNTFIYLPMIRKLQFCLYW